MQTSFKFDAIGTHWQIDIKDTLKVNEDILLKDIKSFIDQFDKDYSRFRKDSLVTNMSKKAGVYELPVNAKPMIFLYKKIYDLTNHAVTPLIGRVMEDAGYDATYSLLPKKLTRPFTWDEALTYKFPNLSVKKPVLLDFGAAGKGYLIDLVSKILKKNKINNFCIDAGGDILYSNNLSIPLKVGLEHPDNISQVIGTVEINNESICGSAGNRRKWGKFNHIINPLTLKPVTDIKAVWVIAESTMIADGISTCLFFVSPERLQNDFRFSYLILYKDLTFKKSDDFNAELFIK